MDRKFKPGTPSGGEMSGWCQLLLGIFFYEEKAENRYVRRRVPDYRTRVEAMSDDRDELLLKVRGYPDRWLDWYRATDRTGPLECDEIMHAGRRYQLVRVLDPLHGTDAGDWPEWVIESKRQDSAIKERIYGAPKALAVKARKARGPHFGRGYGLAAKGARNDRETTRSDS